MSHPTFYDPQLPQLQPGAPYTLSGAEGRHASQVRRIRVGETVDVVDGAGTRVTGAVTHLGKNEFTIAVAAVGEYPPPRVRLILVQALAKGGRDETAIEAATEVGVDGVLAWESHRSVSQWRGEKQAKGLARWEAILTSAMKQSRRSHLPTLHGFARGEGLTEQIPEGAEVLVLHETATDHLSKVDLPQTGQIALVVGPEGGLTEAEVDFLVRERGAKVVLLGPEVVRTSTAGPVALAILNARLGRW